MKGKACRKENGMERKSMTKERKKEIKETYIKTEGRERKERNRET